MGPNGRTGAHLGLRRLPPSFPSCEAGWAPPRRLAEVLLCAIAEALPLPVQDDLAVSQRRAGLRFDSNRVSVCSPAWTSRCFWIVLGIESVAQMELDNVNFGVM